MRARPDWVSVMVMSRGDRWGRRLSDPLIDGAVRFFCWVRRPPAQAAALQPQRRQWWSRLRYWAVVVVQCGEPGLWRRNCGGVGVAGGSCDQQKTNPQRQPPRRCCCRVEQQDAQRASSSFHHHIDCRRPLHHDMPLLRLLFRLLRRRPLPPRTSPASQKMTPTTALAAATQRRIMLLPLLRQGCCPLLHG